MNSLPIFTSLLFLPLLLLSTTFAQNDLNCNAHDKVILLQVKTHFNAVGLLSDWDPTEDCCDWPFIGCTGDGNPNPGRVTALTISGGSGLAGNIPEVIGNLPFLDNLMFFDERKLVGPIPQSFSKLSNLRVLTLNSNSLSGNIPTFLGQLKKLQQVDISDNRFTGGIPPSLSNLRGLTSFNVSHNMLCGAIPAGLHKFDASVFEHNKCLCGPPLPACKSV